MSGGSPGRAPGGKALAQRLTGICPSRSGRQSDSRKSALYDCGKSDSEESRTIPLNWYGDTSLEAAWTQPISEKMMIPAIQLIQRLGPGNLTAWPRVTAAGEPNDRRPLLPSAGSLCCPASARPPPVATKYARRHRQTVHPGR